MFTFTPLLGAHAPSPASQSLLELDGGVKILIDVGWDSIFGPSALKNLDHHVSTLSLVLLTHATTEHLGAYAHCCKHVPGFSKIPVYATTPVVNLGRTLMLDVYASATLSASVVPREAVSGTADEKGETAKILLQAPTAEEIAAYFNAIHPLKYSQPHQPMPSPFSPPLGGLTVTAYSAGHTLGGTIWHVQHGLESIVHAADWSLGKEGLFPGAAWLSSDGGTGAGEVIEPLQRPTAMICSSRGVERKDVLPKSERDEMILSLVRDTIAQGGKVLLPTDSSARLLELAFILNQTWRENMDGPHADTYKNAKVFMASKSSVTTVRYLQSMLEWMDGDVVRSVEAAMTKGKGSDANSPLKWDFVRQIERQKQVEKVLSSSKPCVMLASDASMEWGFSRHALQKLAEDPKNLVLLTEKMPLMEDSEKGVGRQLWEHFQSNQDQATAQNGAKVVSADGVTLNLREATTAPLSADENAIYQQYLARQFQTHSTLQGDNTITDTTTAEIADDQASESSESEEEDEDTEHQGRALNLSAQLTSNKRKVGLTDAELGINILLRGKNVHDYDVRNKRGREKMFPFVAHRTRHDEFGDMIKPEDYLRAEERDEINGLDMRDGERQDGQAVGQKRKWGDAQSGARNGRGPKSAQQKRAKLEEAEHEPDDIDAIIARATGEEGGADGADGSLSDGSGGDDSDYDPADVEKGGPRKVIFSTRSLELRLRIAHVDFSGLYRIKDLQMLLPRIHPRKLILTAGDASETKMLAEECRSLEGGSAVGEVFAPLLGETVDASVDTNAWTLKLSRPLLKRLNWQHLHPHGLSLAGIAGQLGLEVPTDDTTKASADENAKKKLKMAQDESTEVAKPETPAMPVLNMLAAINTIDPHQRAATHQQPIHVGDLRLAQIRHELLSTGHTAEFRGGGSLLVDGSVLVKKSQATGGIEVEAAGGGLGVPKWRTMDGEGSFYAVRKCVYSRLAVVGGG